VNPRTSENASLSSAGRDWIDRCCALHTSSASQVFPAHVSSCGAAAAVLAGAAASIAANSNAWSRM
jgi:hypothetical protein